MPRSPESTTSADRWPAGGGTAGRRVPSTARLVVVLGALSAFGPLSLDMYLPGLPRLTTDLAASTSAAQLTITACLVGLAVGQLVAGPVSDRYGRRRPLLVGLAGYAVTSALCAFAPSVGVLVVLRLAQGLAGAAGIVISRAVVRDLFAGTALARFFALLLLVNGLAPIVAPIAGGQLLRVTDWRGVFVVLAGIGVALFATALLGLPETLPAARRHGGGFTATLATFRRLLADRLFVGYALSCGLATAAMFAYIAGSPFVLQGMFGISPQAFSLIFATNALGIVLAGQASGRLVGRVSPERLLGVGLAGNLAGGLGLLASVLAGGGLVPILVSFFLTVASLGLVMPNANALALAAHGRTAGSASALLGLAQYLVGGLAAPLVGTAGQQTAVPLGVVAAAAVVGASAVYVGLVRRRPVS